MGKIVRISKYTLNLKLYKNICQNLYSITQFLKKPVKKFKKVSYNNINVQRFLVSIKLEILICNAPLKDNYIGY